MKTTLDIAAAAFGLLLLALSAPAANDAPQASLTFRLVATTQPSHAAYRDRPPTGPSKGDVITGTEVLRNVVAQFGRPKGAVVGREYAVLTLSSRTVGFTKLRVYLPGGTLRVQGRIYFAAHESTILVVAGTGRFAGASGTCHIRSGSTRVLNVYRLVLP